MKKDPHFYSASLQKMVTETPDIKHLELHLENADLEKTYQVPGQYIRVHLQGRKAGIFALSSPPFDSPWTLLVKKNSTLADELHQLPIKSSIFVSSAEGSGFPMVHLEKKNILFFAAGSGIAPIRAALWHFFKERNQYGNFTLYYGVRNSNDFAYKREFKTWQKNGVKIILAISNEKELSWEGSRGYVQNLIPSDLDISNTKILACGMKGMIEGVTQKLFHLGLPKKFVLTNY